MVDQISKQPLRDGAMVYGSDSLLFRLTKPARVQTPRLFYMTPNKRGGARKGAGRKAGSGKGRTVISKTVAMTAESWARLDAVRGTMSRGKYLGSCF